MSRFRGFSFYLILLLAAMLVWNLASLSFSSNGSCTYGEFLTALEKDNVAQVEIQQNAETPTGAVVFKTTNGQQKTFYVSDVNQITKLLSEHDMNNYVMTDTKRDGIFVKVILPFLLVGVVVFFLFALINSQAKQSGGGSEMMNFGKSRAKMTTDASKLVTFKEVAGLNEEKEE